METIRRRRDKYAEEQEQKKKEEEELRKARGVAGVDTSGSMIQKDNSLEQLLKKQKIDWEKDKIESELESKRERPTLHNIELPNLKPAGFSVWRAFHELGYPPPDTTIDELEESGIPKVIQERFQIGCIENLMEAAQVIAKKFKPDELAAAGLHYLKDYAQKNVPILLFPYLRDKEICFMTCRAFMSREERHEIGIPMYVRMGEKIPFPYNSNCFEDILNRERKKVFFLYPSRYRLNILSKEEDVLVVAEKGFEAIAIREFHMEEEWLKLSVNCEPVIIIDESDRTFPDWRKHVDKLSADFSRYNMVLREEILPEGIIVPNWFVKSNLGERTFKVDRPPGLDKPKKEHN
jgi:hypothetical protein